MSNTSLENSLNLANLTAINILGNLILRLHYFIDAFTTSLGQNDGQFFFPQAAVFFFNRTINMMRPFTQLPAFLFICMCVCVCEISNIYF